VTTNVDDLRNKETREIIAQRLTKMKIDISAIQETRRINNGEWGKGEYTFYMTTERKIETEISKKNKPKTENQKGIGE